jgi:hypothetical protein
LRLSFSRRDSKLHHLVPAPPKWNDLADGRRSLAFTHKIQPLATSTAIPIAALRLPV